MSIPRAMRCRHHENQRGLPVGASPGGRPHRFQRGTHPPARGLHDVVITPSTQFMHGDSCNPDRLPAMGQAHHNAVLEGGHPGGSERAHAVQRGVRPDLVQGPAPAPTFRTAARDGLRSYGGRALPNGRARPRGRCPPYRDRGNRSSALDNTSSRKRANLSAATTRSRLSGAPWRGVRMRSRLVTPADFRDHAVSETTHRQVWTNAEQDSACG